MTGVTSPATRSLAHEALAYASRGIQVFPLWWVVSAHDEGLCNCVIGRDCGRICACSDGANCGSPGKHPRVPRGVTQATNDMRQVEQWWALWPHANIGLPAGANGLAIIDVDPYHDGNAALADLDRWCLDKHGVDLISTRTIRTGSGGLHRYYREPVGGIKTGAKTFGANGIDTRGRGGYVVAPPSRHASGHLYEVIRDVELMPWPACLTRLMEYKAAPLPAAAPARSTPTGGATREQRWARRGLDAECDALRAMTTAGSGRNNALNVAAYKIGRRVGAGLLAEAEAADALYAAASGWQGHGERELRATIASGLRGGMANPHAGPAPRGSA